MPEYLAVSGVSVRKGYTPRLKEGFDELYILEKEFNRPRSLMDEIANNHFYLSPQTDVYLYRIGKKHRAIRPQRT